MSATTKVLVFAALLLCLIAYLRPPEYDEAYSLFLTAGDARPAWPAGVFTPASVSGLYAGRGGFGQIAHDLRAHDVHPPLYFWILSVWREVFGPSWFAARLLSVVITLAALATLARLCRLTGTPTIPALLLCLLAYGFAYTGIVARGIALAQLLLLVGVTCVFAGMRSTRHSTRAAGLAPACAGLALGAATFTNYLALFAAVTALGILTLAVRGRALPGLFAFALFLPADASFFAAQRASRAGQFPDFTPMRAAGLVLRDAAAACFGGLPLYAGSLAAAVTLILILLTAVTIGFAVREPRPQFAPLAALTAATPAGLLLLGLLFDNTPIELRYFAFSVPYLAMLIAGSAPRTLQGALIALESLAIIGLAAAPATQQPQQRAAREAARLAAPDTLVLLPFGNDGVGIPGPFIAAAPRGLKLLLLRPGATPSLTGQTSIVLATISIDGASRAAVARTLAYLETQPCWRMLNETALVRQYRDTCAAHGQTIKARTD